MNQLPVARHGRVVGVISHDAIMSYVEAEVRRRSEVRRRPVAQEARKWEDARRREMNQITAPLPAQPQPQPQIQTQTQDTPNHHEPM
jgi:hypothetical protein